MDKNYDGITRISAANGFSRPNGQVGLNFVVFPTGLDFFIVVAGK
jgi:hypothetical protein